MAKDQGTDENNNQWGCLPLMMEVAQKTVTPIREIYNFAVTEFFYYASYLIEENKRRIAEMKKIKTR